MPLLANGLLRIYVPFVTSTAESVLRRDFPCLRVVRPPSSATLHWRARGTLRRVCSSTRGGTDRVPSLHVTSLGRRWGIAATASVSAVVTSSRRAATLWRRGHKVQVL